MVTINGGVAEFRFFRPDAKQVHVVGDFNDWQAGRSEMISEGDGHWRATLRLPVGEYRFRYLVDGQWFTDFAAHGVEPSEHGLDSRLVIQASGELYAAA